MFNQIEEMYYYMNMPRCFKCHRNDETSAGLPFLRRGGFSHTFLVQRSTIPCFQVFDKQLHHR